jgi:hypothetical protein
MRKICVTIFAALLLAFVAVAAAPAERFGGNKQIAECWHFCIFIGYDLDVADEILSSDFVWHYGFARALAPGQDSVVGVQPAKVASIVLNTGFSELGVVHDVVFSHGDLVEVRWTASGVHTGELLGNPPTGCKVIFTGNDLFRIRNGKIVELWQETDLLDLTTQLQQPSCVGE